MTADPPLGLDLDLDPDLDLDLDLGLDLDAALDRIPEGWSRVRTGGRTYGLTRTTHTGGRSVSLYAEELGGPDVVSANVWRLAGGAVLKPCEMPVEKVKAFLRDWQA